MGPKFRETNCDDQKGKEQKQSILTAQNKARSKKRQLHDIKSITGGSNWQNIQDRISAGQRYGCY